MSEPSNRLTKEVLRNRREAEVETLGDIPDPNCYAAGVSYGWIEAIDWVLAVMEGREDE
jgi:hypothetical protein